VTDPVERAGPAAPPAAAPRWARALDAGTVAAAGLAVFVAVAGRELLLRSGQVELPSSPFLLFLSGSLLAVRHAACPAPSIAATLAGWTAWLDGRPHAAAAVRAFVATRLMVLVVGYFAVVTMGFGPTPGFVLSDDPLANLPARYDAGWYGGIARSGYEWDRQFDRQRNIAFFPALPMIMRPVGSLLGAGAGPLSSEQRLLRLLWGGVIVSLAAFGWALYYLARLADLLAGPRAAMWAPLLLASYPFAVFFSAPYTEALFLLGSVGAFYHFHRAEWTRAAVWGLLVGLSRPNGFLLSAALAALALQQQWPLTRARLTGLRSALLAASMPGVAMLLFTAYLYRLTGVWFVWAEMHGAWGRTWGTGPIAQGWEWLTTEGLMNVLKGVPHDALNTFPVLFVLALVWPVFRRLGFAYALFILLNLIPPIFAGGALSMGRITSTLFPAFIVLAVSLPPRAVPAWASAFAIMQGLMAALFFTWREMF
jgi:hypothetical protein